MGINEVLTILVLSVVQQPNADQGLLSGCRHWTELTGDRPYYPYYGGSRSVSLDPHLGC